MRLWSSALLLGALACSSGEASRQPASAESGGAPVTSSPANPAQPDSLTEAADRSRTLGSASARVWMLVISDFQCPYCKAWHDSTFPAIRREYVEPGKIRVAYLNLPLRQHANAWPAAMAAMCAAAQGKFWETSGRLFDTQTKWAGLPDPTAYLDSLAIASGADSREVRSCTQGRRLMALIEGDQVRAEKAGISSTPVFFVGSRMIEGAQPVGEFRRVIDSVLAAVRQR